VTASAAIIDGDLVARDDLYDLIAEAAGGQVLEEMILDRRLQAELSRRGQTISQADVDAETERLFFLIQGRVAADGDEAARVIEAARTARGLGPRRYRALLRRNAMLRRLVRDEVTIAEEDVQRLFEVRHGARVRARIIVVPTERDAAAARAEIAPADDLSVAFARVAMDRSTDASASRGGMIEPFSTRDPAYPLPAREALRQVNPGELTPVIALDTGFAIFLLEDRLDGDDATLEEERTSITRELRLRTERVLMQGLALELLGSSRVTIIDDSLGWSWQQRLQAR
jgi:parvulin-like peptidyl-prolyl isomerase